MPYYFLKYFFPKIYMKPYCYRASYSQIGDGGACGLSKEIVPNVMLVSKVQPRNNNKYVFFFKGHLLFYLIFIYFEFDSQMFCNVVGKYVVKLGNNSMFDN